MKTVEHNWYKEMFYIIFLTGMRIGEVGGPYLEAHCQYLFYLTLKYKDVAEFNNIFLKEQISKSIQKLDFEDFPCIKESIGNITTIIEDLKYKIITEQSREGVRDQEEKYIESHQLTMTRLSYGVLME